MSASAMPPPSTDPPSSKPPPRNPVLRVLRLWFGFRDRVSRGAYVASGLGLMALKYGMDALLVAVVTGVLWSPLAYFNPVYSMRTEAFRAAPEWLFLLLVLNAMPFLWIGVTMSVRRAVDAGVSAWVGLLFLVPILNFVGMAILSLLPGKGGAWNPSMTTPYRAPTGPQRRLPLNIDPELMSALQGFGAALAVGLGMVGFSVYTLGSYGAALFFVTPFVMGSVSAFLYNRPLPQPVGKTLGVAMLSVAAAGSAMLLFALEGLICLLMAFPIAAVIATIGAVVGRAIALNTATTMAQTAAMVLVLPGVAGAEKALEQAEVHEVVTVVEIDAPPSVVWPNVIGFNELDPPAEWVFHTGLAYPMRATIEGEGVGAVRKCEFSTGPFIEPITVWDEPRRLGFDVASQPPAMKEWSPYRYVHPPHLAGSLRSKRGEFRLIALPDNRTRLYGSTWYELSMFPEVYWRVWTEKLLHQIHQRVLEHVKKNSEAARG